MSIDNYWQFAGDYYPHVFLLALVLFGFLNPEGPNGYIWVILCALFWPIMFPLTIWLLPVFALLAGIDWLKHLIGGGT